MQARAVRLPSDKGSSPRSSSYRQMDADSGAVIVCPPVLRRRSPGFYPNPAEKTPLLLG